MAQSSDKAVIKEGFLCPVCHQDLRSPNALLVHFQDLHSEEQDLLTSIKDLVSKAKKKILKSDEQEIEVNRYIPKQQYFLEASNVPQEVGHVRDHTEYFKDVRRNRLDHRTTETNKLIIRLDKLIHLEGSSRKQNEQELVEWLDGTTVTRCPSCASSFNITRRQHHCRLCGSIMCNNCSTFLSYEIAKSIVTSIFTLNKGDTTIKNDTNSIRICNHCMGLLEIRRRVQMSQTEKPIICHMYEQLHRVRGELEPLVDLYKKMYDSIMDGDSKYSLQDAQSLRASIAKHAEQLDLISKRILDIPEDEINFKIQAAIRQATYQYIKEYVLNQPILPTPAEIEKIKKGRSYRVTEVHQPLGIPKIRKVAVTTGWSPDNASENNHPDVSDDPLLQQMNIVRNYIQQARKAHRFEEVASLEENLKMLKETYLSQQKINGGSENKSAEQ